MQTDFSIRTYPPETEWIVWLYEERENPRILYNRQQHVRGATRKEALNNAIQLVNKFTRVAGVSLIPAQECYNLNSKSK